MITKADEDGNNALHIACIHGQLHIVQFLLQHGLSAEIKYVLCTHVVFLTSFMYIIAMGIWVHLCHVLRIMDMITL